MDLTHFITDAHAFFVDLAAHNEREWFKANSDRYERLVREPGIIFSAALCTELEKLTGHSMEAKIFRIHRDLRFSKDKRPYKTYQHIGFSPAGQANDNHCGGFLFGIETERVVIGAGTIAFPPETLKKFRSMVAREEEGTELETMISQLQQKGARMEEPELKRVPRGVDPRHPHAELLRRKSLAVLLDLAPDQEVDDPVSLYLEKASLLLPIYQWLHRLSSTE
ncbi:MAG: DUF2461 domain-containing protein [Magnetococcales bacterium]|nr:DUF2461 domain-containing protein [Magnetococcales bacterium]MBF0149984.1 DUF2461 domain-containing protein [Magnetococcales bacterium]